LGARGRYRDALQRPDFRLLVSASLIDQIGSWSYAVVIAVDIYSRTGSTVWLAGLSASRWVTGLLLSGYAGVLADRYQRTTVMIASATANGIVMAGIALSVGLHGPVWTLLVLTVLSATAAAPYRPAAGALTPQVVDEKDLAAANGIFAAIESVVVVVGPGIGGLLLLSGSTLSGVVINAASFFVAAFLVSRLTVRSRGDAEPGGRIVAQWVAGFRALASERVAITLVAFCALDSMVYGASTVIYAPLSVRLGTGPKGYSYLLAGSALGGVLAAGLANRLSGSRRLAPIIVGSIALQSLPYLVTAFVHAPVAAFVLQVVSGVGMIIVDILAITALQRDLDRGVLSRVLGAFDAIVTSAILLASFAVAALLSHSGVVVTLEVTGIAIPVLAVLGLPILVQGDRRTAAEAARIEPTVELLAGLDLFTGANRPVLERLAQAAEPRTVPTGTVLIRQGDPADALWVLVSGVLSVSAAADGGPSRALPSVVAPAYVGEIGLVRGVPRTATVRTEEDCELLRIDGAEFLRALESAPPSTAFVQLTGTRWARTEQPATG